MPDLSPPTLPLGVRALNLGGRALDRVGVRLPSLDVGRLRREATRRTGGLTDFGDPSHTEALERLVHGLEHEAGLHQLGRIIVREELLRFLTRRLRLEDWHRRHPEIGEERIEAPIVIVGQARTGTSILHELLAQDTRHRIPRSWECEEPFPPPEAATYTTDPRIAEAQGVFDHSDRLIPNFKRVHRMGALLPQECVRITGSAFIGLMLIAQYRLPTYTRWLLEEADHRPAYRWHRRFLQLLQWRCPGSPWVLKSPGHLLALPALLDVYPDARIVRTHRDPLKVVSSMTSLVVMLRGMTSSANHGEAVAREWVQTLHHGFEMLADVHEAGLLPADQVHDVPFAAFMADPLAEVGRIYEAFGLELGDGTRARMEAYLREHGTDEHGGHKHSFADTGLDPGEVREKMARYQRVFDVPSESLR